MITLFKRHDICKNNSCKLCEIDNGKFLTFRKSLQFFPHITSFVNAFFFVWLASGLDWNTPLELIMHNLFEV